MSVADGRPGRRTAGINDLFVSDYLMFLQISQETLQKDLMDA